MAWTLERIKDYLEDPDNWQDLGKVMRCGKDYIGASNIAGGAWDYMKESLLEWLDYHSDSVFELTDAAGMEYETTNAPSIDQERALVIWAWDYSLDISDVEARTLDDVVSYAASELESAAVLGLMKAWPEIEAGLDDLEGDDD